MITYSDIYLLAIGLIIVCCEFVDLARPYTYMTTDGAFKQFRRSDIPCVW